MIGQPAKLGRVHGTITGYAESDKKVFLVWLQLVDEELRLTGKQLKKFLVQNRL